MKKTVLSRSRRSFFIGYIFALVFLSMIFFIYILDIFPPLFIYLLSFPAIYLILLPEYSILNDKYIIKDENVESVSGIIAKKKKIIPWSLVSDVSMKKGVLGVFLDFGDVFVNSIGGTKEKIVMKGISDPEKILRKIENKIGKGKVLH